MPVSEAEFNITSILEALAKDPWPVTNDKRALRCTGVALGVAIGMLEVRIPRLNKHISNISHRLLSPVLALVSCFSQAVHAQRALAW